MKVPLAWTLIETEMPHLINAIFGQTTIIDLKAKFDDPGNDKTFKMKSFLNNNFINVCDGEEKFTNIERTALIYGTAAVKVWWNAEEELELNQADGSMQPVNSAHPDFDLVDPKSFAWDRGNATKLVKNCRWVRERIYKEKEEMLMMRDNGKCGWFNKSDLATAQNKKQTISAQSNTSMTSDSERKTYYDEYQCTMFDKDENGKYTQAEYLVWVLAENRVIKFVPMPLNRKMYAIGRCYDFPGEFMGKGEPDTIGALAEHSGYIWYQLGKTVKRVGQQMTLVGMGSGLSPEQMRTIEDGIFPVDDISQITFQPSMDATDVQVLAGAFKTIKEEIADTTGVGPALQGESIGDVSATEASYVFQNASNRLEMKLKNMQKGLIEPIAEMMFLLCKQSLTDPNGITFFTSDNKPQHILPEDFIR